VDCTPEQRIQVVDDIAYPAKAKPEMSQGVAFFNKMRDLTATGFYTTQMGWDDIGYKGNVPEHLHGVPDDVLDAFGVKDMNWG
jgi:gluconate 2-dehydrogenase gamma chain